MYRRGKAGEHALRAGAANDVEGPHPLERACSFRVNRSGIAGGSNA